MRGNQGDCFVVLENFINVAHEIINMEVDNVKLLCHSTHFLNHGFVVLESIWDRVVLEGRPAQKILFLVRFLYNLRVEMSLPAVRESDEANNVTLWPRWTNSSVK